MDRFRYCSLKPSFHKDGWGIAVFLHEHGEFGNLTVLHPLFTSLSQLQTHIKKMQRLFPSTKNLKSVGIYDECILIPLTLKNAVPLKREFWLKPVVDFNVTVRDRAFLPALDNPAGFEFLVVPQRDKKGRWRFEVAAPFRAGDKEGIEAFMKTSNYPTSELASEAALYEVQVCKKLNWRTGEIGESDKSEGVTQ